MLLPLLPILLLILSLLLLLLLLITIIFLHFSIYLSSFSSPFETRFLYYNKKNSTQIRKLCLCYNVHFITRHRIDISQEHNISEFLN